MAILSIFKEADFLRVALLIQKKKLYRILFLQEYCLSSFDITDLLYTIKKETGLTYDEIDVISPLETKDICIKQTTLPFKEKIKIHKALTFFSLQNFTFDKKNLVVSPLTKTQKSSSNSVLFATSTQLILKHIQLYSNLELTPDSITCIPAALGAFALNFCTPCQRLFVINVGFDQLNMVLVDHSTTTHCFNHHIGLKDFIDTLIDNDYTPSKIDADLIKNLIENIISKNQQSHPLFNCTEMLKKTIERFIDSCNRGLNNKKPLELLFTGYGLIIEKAFYHSHYQIANQRTKHHIEYDSFTLKKYAIELGSALQLTKPCSNQILFTIKGAKNPKINGKINYLIKSSALLMSTLFTLLFCLCNFTLKKQEGLIHSGIESCAVKMDLAQQLLSEKSLSQRVSLIQKEHLKKLKQRAQIKKIQSLSPIVNFIYKKLGPRKINSFSYKLQDKKQIITFKLDKYDTKDKALFENIKNHYKNNLIVLEEKNGTIHYALKY